MTNKLSELKVAAAKYSLTLKAHRENPKDRDAVDAWDTASDEFSRAINNDEMDIIAALLAELEATRKQSQELAKQCGRLGARAAIAERKLATPVRLPERYYVDCGVGPDPNGDWLYYSEVANTLREQGFTVEGGE